MENKKTKKKPKIVKKPFLTGSPVDGTTAKAALTFFGGMLLMLLAYLLLCSMMLWDSLFLRIVTNGLVMVAVYALFFLSGMSKGATAVNSGEIMYQRKAEGKPVDAGDLKTCYHPLKGFVTGLLGSLPFFLCALVLAVIAQQQFYGLSALPNWLEPYTRRSDIGNALAYYSVTDPMGVESVLRLIVRAMMMPLVSIVGTSDSAALLTLERLSPLVALIPAVFHGIGYTRGVQARTQVHSSIAAANRKYKRKEKKKQQRRARGPEQLN